jgi:hypothetical protein
MKVFSGFLNQNIHGDFRMAEKERMKFPGGEETPTEEVEESRSSNTSPSVIVLMVHPDRASSDPGCTTTLSLGDI